MLAACFGVLAASHLVSVVVLTVMGSAPAQYYTEAAYLGAWSLVLVSSDLEIPRHGHYAIKPGWTCPSR